MSFVGWLMLYLVVVGAVAHVPMLWWLYWRAIGLLVGFKA